MELSNKAQSEDQELGLNPVTRQPTLSKAAAAGCTVWGGSIPEQSFFELHDRLDVVWETHQSGTGHSLIQTWLWHLHRIPDIGSTSYAAVLAMSPCRWPQIGWFRCQTAHILQKSNAGFQLGEAATCRWELSTMFWMSRQSRTDRKPPRWTVRAQTVNFLELNVFHFHPKNPDYIFIYRLHIDLPYCVPITPESYLHLPNVFQDKNMDNEAPPAFATCFSSCHRNGHKNLLKSQKQLFQPGVWSCHIIIYNLYNWWQSL